MAEAIPTSVEYRTALPEPVAGQPLDLWIAAQEGVRKFETTVVSQQRGRLVVEWPMARLHFVPVQARQMLRLEAGRADGFYSTDAQVQRVPTMRAPHLHLRVLGPWQYAQRRSVARLPVSIRPTFAARVTQGELVEPITAVILNLGVGGLLVRSDDALHGGAQLEFGFALPGGGVELRVRAEVRHAVERERDGTRVWEANCAFDNPSTSVRELIDRFVHERLAIEPVGPDRPPPAPRP